MKTAIAVALLLTGCVSVDSRELAPDLFEADCDTLDECYIEATRVCYSKTKKLKIVDRVSETSFIMYGTVAIPVTTITIVFKCHD